MKSDISPFRNQFRILRLRGFRCLRPLSSCKGSLKRQIFAALAPFRSLLTHRTDGLLNKDERF